MVKLSFVTEDLPIVRDWVSKVILTNKTRYTGLFDFKCSLKKIVNGLCINMSFEPFLPKQIIYNFMYSLVLFAVLFLIFDKHVFLVLSIIVSVVILMSLFIRSKFYYILPFKLGLRKAGYKGVIKFIWR